MSLDASTIKYTQLTLKQHSTFKLLPPSILATDEDEETVVALIPFCCNAGRENAIVNSVAIIISRGGRMQ
eukprot:scaffold6778_cov97-Skeletonema_dohrnii-CCMP3373.AAC.9